MNIPYTDEDMKRAVRRYLDAVNTNDPDRMASLYRVDATVEDPVGSGRTLSGRDEIREFYRRAFSEPLRVELEGEPRGSYSNAAAYAFQVRRGSTVLSVIGVLTFDEDELISSMCAYYGPSDRRDIA